VPSVTTTSLVPHGRVHHQAARAGRRLRVLPVVHRNGTATFVQGVPFVRHVLLHIRVVLRAVRVGPKRRRPSHVDRSRFELVVEMRLRMESGKSDETDNTIRDDNDTEESITKIRP